MFRRWFIAVLFAALSLTGARAQTEARFDLLEFEITGNTVLPVTTVERAVLPFLGEGRSIDDVEAARTALEKAYQDAGFLTVFVDVPEQRVSEGLVTLRVTEGRVERLRVTGSRYYDQGFIRDRVHQLAPGTVPDFNAMQRQLASVNRDERQIQPLLRPGLAPGTVEAELRVTDRLPLSAGIELNNRHAADTPAWRSTATLRYDNLFQRDHSLAATVITAPQDTKASRVLSLGYTAPLDGGASLGASLVLSDSRSEPLGAATVLGRGSTFGLRWVHSQGSPTALHTLSAGFDLKDFRERVVAGSDDLSTPLRYLPLAAGYNANWYGTGWTGSLNTTLTVGLRNVLGRRIDCPGNIGQVDQFACKREGADGSFSTWRADTSGTWQGLTLRLAGQLATQPLVSSEQYTIGGAGTVRGYYEAEASGDLALLGSLEWRSGNLVAAAANGPPLRLGSATVLAFVDAARVTTLQPAAGQAARVPLAGAGFGLRLRAQPGLDAEFDLAWPLKATRTTPEREPRLHARLAAQF